MIVENHAKGKIFWPNKQRVAVAITFDFKAASRFALVPAAS